MAKGHLALVLHAHLPYVRHPEHEEFLEEHWLFEAITETYVPLIQTFENLLDLVYHLKNADELSLQDYGYERIPTYQVAMQLIASLQLAQHTASCGAEDFDCQLAVLQARLSAMQRVFELFIHAAPSTHFRINLHSGELVDLWGENPFRA